MRILPGIFARVHFFIKLVQFVCLFTSAPLLRVVTIIIILIIIIINLNVGIIPCGADAMLIADLTASPKPIVYKQPFYWYVGHVSRFVPAGSVRIASPAVFNVDGSRSPLHVVAFRVPSDETVLVAMNPSDFVQVIILKDARFGSASSALPAHSIQTWIY